MHVGAADSLMTTHDLVERASKKRVLEGRRLEASDLATSVAKFKNTFSTKSLQNTSVAKMENLFSEWMPKMLAQEPGGRLIRGGYPKPCATLERVREHRRRLHRKMDDGTYKSFKLSNFTSTVEYK